MTYRLYKKVSLMLNPNSLEIFVVPIMEYYLLYAPLNAFVALVDRIALKEIQIALLSNNPNVSPTIKPIVEQLRSLTFSVPNQPSGPISSPLFLGLITTRNCNMRCVYCDFVAPRATNSIMDIQLARAAINSYLNLLLSTENLNGRIHFFGGEPLYPSEVVDFVVNYARMRFHKSAINVEFEMITNGFCKKERAYWLGDNFYTVILSLDGPEEIQDRNRQGFRGRKLSQYIFGTAKILSDSPTELILRSCITSDTVEKIPEIAQWIAREFRPSAWCIETLVTTPLTKESGLYQPDPWVFAKNFDLAAQILREYDIRVVNSTVELDNLQISCCPVGRDAILISPEGRLVSCYLLESDWTSKGMDMSFGSLSISEHDEDNRFLIDYDALRRIRNINIRNKKLCKNCICRYSCAGGCHVDHATNLEPGTFDNICIQTRLITISKLLRAMGQDDLVAEWFASKHNWANSVWQKTDRIEDLCINDV